jgi:hypothetical protein
MLTFAIILTLATPAPGRVAQAAAAATPTPNPLTVSGFFRSYYFTRQNASNNPGVQFNYSPGAKYVSSGVNQASLNNAIDLHADYQLPFPGFYVGGTYFYADPFDDSCSTALTHAKGKPCVTQIPPNTNPDDTLPGFILNTFLEGYVAYKDPQFAAKVGDQLFSSPWAGPVDTRVKPAAFQGGDFAYTPRGWTFEAAEMLQFEPRTSSTFQSNTLITSFPAGNQGMGSNIFFQGGGGKNTGGFFYDRIGYAPKGADYSVNGYFWDVSDIVNIYWGDARYTVQENRWKPYLALQGGWESNAGASYAGKIASSLFGAQLGFNATKTIVVAASYDGVPWKYDRVSTNYLSSINWTCSNTNYQFKPTNGLVSHTLAYFLPVAAGQCFQNPNGTTTIAYGGWASPFTDNYATNPVFTTQVSQGEPDRRAGVQSYKIAATYTSQNGRGTFIASDAWYNYGNNLVGQNTNEWNLDGTYRFMPVFKDRPYHGLQFRYRYAQRSYSNTYFCAAGSICPAGSTPGSTYLGGIPLFKYNRAMLEYDF